MMITTSLLELYIVIVRFRIHVLKSSYQVL
nr:MAG TPA: hypothetical protein [Bacteriophage sp.]DAP66554.1 MAG TPA: hypothetical protein [Caudoviricetes sp.]